MEADTEKQTEADKKTEIQLPTEVVSVHQTVDRIEPREGSDQSSNV